MPSRVPCDVGLNRAIACGHPAWTAGWCSYPVSPGFHPGLLGTRVASTKSPRQEPGDSGSHAFPGAMRCGFEPGNCVRSSGMDCGVVFIPGVPGFPPGAFLERVSLPQKAPGRSRGTPGGMPSRVPCDVGLNRAIACGHPAWTAGWCSYPVSPGFHPGLFVWAPGPEGRVDSKRAAARQANRGTMPRIRVDHAPGFPPGASCVGARPGGPG